MVDLLPVVCTATVTNGLKLVTVTGIDANTGLPPVLSNINCRPNATVFIGGVGYVVEQRLSTTTFNAERIYEGVDAAGVTCTISAFTPEMANRTELSRQLREYSARLALVDARGHGIFYQGLGATGAVNPGPGKIARETSDWSLSTKLFISAFDASPEGRDQSPRIGLWRKGTRLAIVSIETGAYEFVELTANPANEGGWWQSTNLLYLGGDGVLADGEDWRIVDLTDGRDLAIDEAGPFAGRAAFDAQPKNFVYLSTDGDGALLVSAVLFIKLSNSTGDWSGAIPFQGPRGYKGWGPKYAAASDGARLVLQLTGWVGGEGTAPTDNVGQYLGPAGYVAAIGDATDIRGPQGTPGLDGASQFNRVHWVATANVDIATFANGSAIDGSVAATGQSILLSGQTAPAQNGPYLINAAGPLTRLAAFVTYDSLPGVFFSVMQGTAGAETTWRCSSDMGGTIGVTALAFLKTSGAVTTALAALAGASGSFPRFVSATLAVMQAIVGTVSQSGGTPTGAIIETGSNANGRYTKWADGTMICEATGTTSILANTGNGQGFQGGSTTNIAFPATFAAAPVLEVSAVYDGVTGARAWLTLGSAPSTTGGSIIAHSFNANGGCFCHYVAKGRWF